MKTILVPFDFSEPATNAYRFALDVAGMTNSTVHLLNVIELPAVPNTVFTPVVSLESNFIREMSANITERIKKVTSKFRQEGVKVISSIESGVLSKTIPKYVKKHKVDMVVMGSHGTKGMRDIFVGSNTEKIVRSSPVPVIVVKGLYKGPIKNIVFPISSDMDIQQDLALNVKALQKLFKAHLHVVWINTPVNFTTDTITIARLNKFAKRFALKDFTINVFNHLSAEEGILQFAFSVGADIVAMGTHGRRGLSHLISGSMTEDLANHGEFLLWTSVVKN